MSNADIILCCTSIVVNLVLLVMLFFVDHRGQRVLKKTVEIFGEHHDDPVEDAKQKIRERANAIADRIETAIRVATDLGHPPLRVRIPAPMWAKWQAWTESTDDEGEIENADDLASYSIDIEGRSYPVAIGTRDYIYVETQHE